MRNTFGRKPRGSALITALIAVIMMATMALGLSLLTLASNDVTVHSEDQFRALQLANTGLSMGFKRVDPSTFTGLPNDTVIFSESYGKGRTVTVYKRTSSSGKPCIESVGTWDTKTPLGDVRPSIRDGSGNLIHDLSEVDVVIRKVQGVLNFPSFTGSFPSGAFGLADLVIQGDFDTDSYNSSGPDNIPGTADDTPYDPANPGNMGNIGTNGTIAMNGASFYVNGNASPGPGQQPINNPAQISGSGAPLLEPVLITIVPYLPPAGAVTSIPSGGNMGSAGTVTNYRLSSLSTQNNDVITVTGAVNIYVDGNIDLKGDFRLADNNSKVNIYQAPGDYTLTINGGGESNTGTMVTIPAQDINHPAQTISYPASTRTVSATTQDQSVPPINEGENSPVPTYKNNGKVDYWTITRPAYTQVIPAYTEHIPARQVSQAGGIPSNFNIISRATGAVKINGNSTFYGTVLAPFAEVNILGTAEKFGAVLGKFMKLGGTGDFHNDTASKSPGFVSKAVLLSITELVPNTANPTLP